MTIKFDVELVGTNIATLDRATASLGLLNDSTNRLTGYGVEPWCGAVVAKIAEIRVVTADTIRLLQSLRAEILGADHLGPLVGGALAADTRDALADLIASIFGSQAVDLSVDDLVDWAQEHPEWLPHLVSVLPYTDAAEVAETARALNPVALVEWWRNAPSALRAELIRSFPALVGLALQGGAKLSDAELGLLRRSVVFSESTTSDSVGLEATIPTTKIDLGIDGELGLAVETLSDGTSLVHVIADAGLSGVVAAKSATPNEWLSSAESSLTLGLGAAGTMSFRFDSVDAANAAIQRVKDAVADAVGSTARAALASIGAGWFPGALGAVHKHQRRAIGAVTEVLSEFGERLETVQGEISAAAVGAASASAVGLVVSGQLGVTATARRSEQIGGDDDDYIAAEIEVAGSAEAKLERPWFLPGDGAVFHGAASGSVTAEVRRYDDGSEVIIVGAAYSATADASSPTTTVHDVSVTVPINADTRAIVEDALRDVGAGKSPVDAISALDEHATIEVKSTAVDETDSKTGAFGNNVVTGEHSSVTNSIRRRGPDGQWYSPAEIEAQIESLADT